MKVIYFVLVLIFLKSFKAFYACASVVRSRVAGTKTLGTGVRFSNNLNVERYILKVSVHYFGLSISLL